MAREVQTWRDGEGRTITRSNPFDKPDSVERLDLEGESYSQHLYFYDGLGRTHHDLDEMQNFRYYQYDAFDRMTLSGLPDGTEVERRYAGHSRKELPTWIGVDGKVIGEQDFDGLGRRLWLEVGSARDEYHYEGSQSRPGEHLTPAGESIAFTYAPQLTTEPVSLMAEDEASYTYDALDARLRVAQNSRGRREFDYDAANHPSVERWCDGDTTWTARYSHSRLGRQWLHEDINGLETRSDYDLAGRLEHVKQGQIEVDYSYDSLSRPYLTRCHDLDSGSELVTTLAFDDWGREVSRTLALSGQPTRSITQAYRPDDRLSSRHQQSAGQTLLLETFAYDERGRLTHHVCSGTQLPMDRFGNAITEQSFDFDALDNLREVYTRFADGSEDTCTRSFATNDPCQLVKLVHTHADYPASLDLDYDANGNLLVDEQGRALAYDRQNRLLQVKNPNGQVLVDYHYDAHNQLCGEDRGSAAHVLRFYQDDRLDCTVQGTTRISYLHTQGRPLAQQQVDSPDGTLLLLTGASNSVLGEGQQQTLRETRYSAFGERSDASLQCPLGFNGEVRDQQTGWYLLGKGYRAYNPYLMCFHSRDFLSPFEAGGINGYMYCAGDPVNFRDPTGHFFDFLPSWMTPVMKWGGLALGAIGVAISLGALVTPGIGLMAAFMKASTLTQISTVASVVSAGTGVGSVMAKDEQTSNVLGTVSFVTGLVGVAVGLKALPNALKKKALNTTTVADDLPQATTPNPVVNNLDDAASSLSAPQSSGNVTTSSSPPAAPSPPQAPSVTQNATQLHMQDSQAISASRQSGAPPENTLSKVRNPASGRRNSI
ncbi:MAG TPA: hypothetical protein DIT18_15395 [Pseudomonas sp.]|nr:hypothetical protein [Pseudomonas sp.]